MERRAHMMMVVDSRLVELWCLLGALMPESSGLDMAVPYCLMRCAYVQGYCDRHQGVRAVSDDEIDLQLLGLWTELIDHFAAEMPDAVDPLGTFMRDAWRQGAADAASETGDERGALYRQLGRNIRPEAFNEAA
jgi:hypothetical protein